MIVDDRPEVLRRIQQQLRRHYGPGVDVPSRVQWLPVEGLHDEFVDFYAERFGEPETTLQRIVDEEPVLPVVLHDSSIFSGHDLISAAHQLGLQEIPVIESF